MAIAIVDFRNYPGTVNYIEQDLSEYLEIEVSQRFFDRESEKFLISKNLALYKCSEDDLGLNGNEKSKFYPINQDDESRFSDMRDLFYCFD